MCCCAVCVVRFISPLSFSLLGCAYFQVRGWQARKHFRSFKLRKQREDEEQLKQEDLARMEAERERLLAEEQCTAAVTLQVPDKCPPSLQPS